MANPKEVDKFYSDASQYWSGVPATVDGMLGGFTAITNTDIQGSFEFLLPFIQGEKATVKPHRACDCGAGIGRITKDLLLPLFDTVDLVDACPKFVEQAKQNLRDRSVDRYICCGLQDFTPEAGRYNLIWIQWVVGHLTDSDLVKFFTRCKTGLAENGIIILKENIASADDCDFDDCDSSYTRPRQLMEELINKAGLKIVKSKKQSGFPSDIYAVWMFAFH